MQSVIKKYQDQFRILKNWKISMVDGTVYYNQCSVNTDNREAAIYTRTSIIDDIDEYIFHEMLHICQFELKIGEYKERREKEELYVQDLCVILKNNKI